MHQLNLDKQSFLKDYWQRKPLLIKQGLAEFADPIEPELLAGLAMEEGVDSRIIINRQQQWLVEHGPFTDYEQYGEADWTLLVQAVNEWFPSVQALLDPFRFLPDWRIDDVMISFATENGSVGPHLDQYDVFIIQGAGTRHWQVGERTQQAHEHYPHEDLKQLKDAFTPVIDAVLEAGDILYIPAGCPHHGVALEPSLNYSIGFRAPNSAEWFAQLADQMLASDQQHARYQDPELTSADAGAVVTERQLQQVRTFLSQALESGAADTYLQQVMSQSKRPLPQPEQWLSVPELQAFAETEMLICRTPGARVLAGVDQAIYANGERYEVSAEIREAFSSLMALTQEAPLAEFHALINNEASAELLCDWLNNGVFHLVREAD